MLNMLKLTTSGNIFNKLFRCQFSSLLSQVKHHPEYSEFSIGHGNDKAVLKYKKIGPSIIDLQHTIVPENLRGQGIGGLLAEAAFEHVINNQLYVRITCDYVQKHLEKNPNPRIWEFMV